MFTCHIFDANQTIIICKQVIFMPGEICLEILKKNEMKWNEMKHLRMICFSKLIR